MARCRQKRKSDKRETLSDDQVVDCDDDDASLTSKKLLKLRKRLKLCDPNPYLVLVLWNARGMTKDVVCAPIATLETCGVEWQGLQGSTPSQRNAIGVRYEDDEGKVLAPWARLPHQLVMEMNKEKDCLVFLARYDE